jgi:two-component system, chemotaxis family, chemotaxis protein CheY
MPTDRTIPTARLASTKVLVVNNDHNLRKQIRNLLKVIGFQNIHEAANGPTGLDIIRAATPDVIILDWEMGLDGERFAQAVRSPGTCPNPDVPIIMLISLASQGRVIDRALFRATKFLIRPISLRSLTASIAAVIEVAKEPWRAVLEIAE